MQNAKTFILPRLEQVGDYSFLPEGVLLDMVDALIALDAAFMKQSGVEEGNAYDDEAACAYIFQGMEKQFSQYRMYMLRLTEDYLDYNEEYLDSIDAIEWE